MLFHYLDLFYLQGNKILINILTLNLMVKYSKSKSLGSNEMVIKLLTR